MAITLTNAGGLSLTLPDNLIWEDEGAWSPVVQTVELTLSGTVAAEEHPRTGGRPITLAGGPPWVWVTRSVALALKAALDVSGLIATLTLHDARTFRVTPRRDDGPPVQIRPLAAIGDSPSANPSSTTLYTVDAIRLLEVPA